MKPDTLVKLRDAFTLAADAIDEELENHAAHATKGHLPSLETVPWKQAIGPKGAANISAKNDKDPNFVGLAQSLREHGTGAHPFLEHKT